MVGTKLYPRRDRVYTYILLYAILAVAGFYFIGKSFYYNENPPGAAGFLVIFGAGMCILTILKSRQPQLSIYDDFLELRQSRTKQLIRYRNIVSVARPDNKRLVVTLHEDRNRKDITIWLKDLEKSKIDELADFLSKEKGRSK